MKNNNNYNLVKTDILGVNITSISRKLVLEYIIDTIENTREKFFIVTPNPEIIVYATNHPEFRKILNSAEIALPDGVGIQIASYLRGKPIQERITGVDFMEELCKHINKKPITVGFLEVEMR